MITEKVGIFAGRALTLNNINTISNEIPIGEGILRAVLRFNLTTTETTASGVISEGVLSFIKNLTFKTNKNEYALRSVPLRGLYHFLRFRNKVSNFKTEVADGGNTARVTIEIPFVNASWRRPQDSIFDSSRNESVTLEITTGTIADLFSTVGDGAVVATVDMYVERTRGRLGANDAPICFPEIGVVPVVNPANSTYIDLERSSDLSYTDLLIASQNSVTSGVPFSGTFADTVLAELSLETDRDYPIKGLLPNMLQDIAKQDAQLDASDTITGLYYLDLLSREGSIVSGALASGLYSRLQARWTNGTLSTSGISLIYGGFRSLK